MASYVAGGGYRGVNADGSYAPEAAKSALVLPAVAPRIIPPIVSGDGFGGLKYIMGHKITTVIGDPPDVADQAAAPTKPADKATSFSTYGVVIPIGLGRRRMSGNVVQSTNIMSVMRGTYDYFETYQVPITTTDEQYGSLTYQPADNAQQGLDLTEQTSTFDTQRVFQNNDNTSDNWIDVQKYKTITLVNAQGVSRTFTFTVS